MSWEDFDIGNLHRFIGFPCRGTHALSSEQPRACHRSLEWAQDQVVLMRVDEVKPTQCQLEADIIADAAFAKFAHPDVSSSNSADNMGASASRRDARGSVMSMGRDSAMGQKYVSTSVKRASQQESSQGEPHTSQHVVALRCQGLLASAGRGACGQHIVHQNHVLAAGDRVP